MDKGLKILFDAFWGKDGCKSGEVSPEAFEIAKAEGYMFDPPEPLDHDETINRIRELCSQITPKQVSDGFLYSLSTHRLEYRGALASYWFGLSIPDHEPKYMKQMKVCRCCDWGLYEFELFNSMNFTRYKVGGGIFTSPVFVMFDLEQFLKLPPVTPTDEDRQILREILHCIDELEPNDSAVKLRDLISKKKILETNKDTKKQEIQTLLEVLGVSGVFSSERNPCYYDDFYVDTYSSVFKNDVQYPLNRWRKKDGISQEWLKRLFGDIF